MNYLLFFLLSLIVGCGSVNAPTASNNTIPNPNVTPTPAQTVNITIKSGAVGKGTAAFGDNPLTIGLNTTVIWTNNDTLAHDFSEVYERFYCGLKPGQSCTVLFKEAGTYNYADLFYQAGSMSGRIIVQKSN